jgi:hypothetical protein
MIKGFKEFINEREERDELADIRRLKRLGVIDRGEYVRSIIEIAKERGVAPGDLFEPGELSQTPQEIVNDVLELFVESEDARDYSEIWKSFGYKITTLSQIHNDRDIPNNSVILSFEHNPRELCYFKKDSKIFEVFQGEIDSERLINEYMSLEEQLGVTYGDPYDDLPIAITPMWVS